MRFFLIFLLCLPSWAGADIYQWRDAHGSKHFSDRSYPDAERIDIKPGYGFYRVKHIYDGDTIVLEDGSKIRLLGVNTPEVQHKDKLADAGGEEAKRWLIGKLQGIRIRLEFDSEKSDKYGRTLAHVFTEKKVHINLELVEAGLAAVNIHPPNLLYADQLTKAGQKAERARIGIWQKDEYAVMPVDLLSETGHPGWSRLQGRVTEIRGSRKFIYLKFSSRFDARIERKWLSLFPDLQRYIGKTIEVRGWLTKNKEGFSMLMRHPSAIKPL